MQQWEYLGVRLIPEAEHGRVTVIDPLTLKGTSLNKLGRDGWEVVGVFRDNFWVLLKRPLQADSAAQPGATGEQQAAPDPGDPPANPLPRFGMADDARERELEQKLQQELRRRQGGSKR